MPPRKKAAVSGGDEPAQDPEAGMPAVPPPAPEPDPAPCPACFPAGWRDEVTACGCEHGSWRRGQAAT